MADRFFATIHAPGEDELRGLQAFHLDVFQATAKGVDEGGVSIEGLLTLEDVGRLVQAGYRVVVEDPMEARVRSTDEQVALEDWRKSVERD